MSLNAENFKIGTCAVVYKNTFMGATSGGPKINISANYSESGIAQTGKQVLRKILQSMRLTAKVKIMEVDAGFEMLLDENGQLNCRELGKDIVSEAGELKLIPFNPEDIVGYRFPHAVPQLDAEYVFDEDGEHILELTFEAFPDTDGMLFEKFTVKETERIDMSYNSNLDMAQFERAVTAYIGEKLNLIVDTDIFRGGIPTGEEGCGVVLAEQRLTKYLASERYEFCFSCLKTDRDEVMQIINNLKNCFPVYGENIILENNDNMSLKAVLNDSIRLNFEIADDGKLKTLGELTLIIVV
jgi:hypothetical protein